MESCPYVYDPTTEPRDGAKFIVYFEEDEVQKQHHRQSRGGDLPP